MANLKVVSLADHETVRARAAVLSDLQEISIRMARELIVLSVRVDALYQEVQRLKQGGETPKS